MTGLVDVETAALATRVSPRAIRARIAAGHLPATKQGKQWWIRWEDLDVSTTSARASRLGLTRHATPAA